MRSGCALAALVAWGCLVPGLASAQDESPVAVLSFRREPGAEACPDEDALRESVAARLGRDPFVPEAPLAIAVRIERVRRGYSALIETTTEGTAPGRRELTSTRDDCRDLGDALALAVSLTVDPTSLLRPPRPAAVPDSDAAPDSGSAPDSDSDPASSSDSASPPASDSDAASASDSAPASDSASAPDPAPVPDPAPDPSSASALLTATILASYGLAPGVSAGLALGAGLRLEAFSIALEARGELPTTEASVRGAPLVGSLAPCGHLDAVALCGVVSVGAFWAEGVDVPAARADATPYFALGARSVVELPLTSTLALRLHAELTVPVIGATLQLGGERAWETPAVGLSLGVGVGARLR